MRNISKYLLMLAVLICGSVIFTSCGSDDDDSTIKPGGGSSSGSNLAGKTFVYD